MRAVLLLVVLASCVPAAPPATAADASSKPPPTTAQNVVAVGLGVADLACALAPTPGVCRAAADALARLLGHPPAPSSP